MPATSGERDATGFSPFVLALRDELRAGRMKALGGFGLGDLTVELRLGRDSLWAIVRRPGKGGIALRAAHAPGGCTGRKRKPKPGEVFRAELDSVLGRHVVTFAVDDADLHRLRMRMCLTPAESLLVPFLPRDLYPLDSHDDPTGAKGRVEAAQRGLNGGLLYFHVDRPAFGSVLYVQDLGAMNPYFRATCTTPDGAVGGEWPELGYLLPTPPQVGTPPVHPLPAGEEMVLSDAILVFRDRAASGEQEMARQFLQMLGAAYPMLKAPSAGFRDWVGRAERTIRDLETAPDATVRHYGHLYARPYVAAEYPDSMVQLSLLAAIRDFGRWRGEELPLYRRLRAGLRRFHDPKLGTLGRYLPNVGDDKDADAVDSWYLYHPLLNLARIALEGDDAARKLFLDSIEFGIKAAHHFDYRWPIQYRASDFSVIEETRGDDRFGQTDVGGLYAYVMLEAYDLTRDERFLHEARAAIDAAKGRRFNLEYQANLTAWGAAACIRLWRRTDEDRYLAQSYTYLASFFHNCMIWESRIAAAEHYGTFMGATALHDAPYMAPYECFDAFAAFERYLRDSGPQLEPAARMLVGEYCKYALDHGWFYYPDALPKEVLATDIRNGHIDRSLSFPLEDLYGDGQPAGQVGQEVYGAGAALVFATHAFHPVADAPFRLFCNHFLLSSERTGDRALTFELGGGENRIAGISLVRLKRRKLPRFTLMTAAGDRLRPRARGPDRIDYDAPADGRLILSWK